MSLYTILYFDENIDLDILYDDLKTVTLTTGDQITLENLDAVEQIITRYTAASEKPPRPRLSMTCAILGKLIKKDVYDPTGKFITEPECFVEVEINSKHESTFALPETHASYIMGLSKREYSFKWKNPFNDHIYDGNDFEALLDFCTLGEVFKNL